MANLGQDAGQSKRKKIDSCSFASCKRCYSSLLTSTPLPPTSQQVQHNGHVSSHFAFIQFYAYVTQTHVGRNYGNANAKSRTMLCHELLTHQAKRSLVVISFNDGVRASVRTYVHASKILEQANDRPCRWAWWVTEFARIIFPLFMNSHSDASYLSNNEQREE